MANITVSPTRMELTRLKGKLKTAQRGHKLLKDKRDELMKQFLDTVREVRSLRAEVEEDLMRVHKSFTVASALMSSEALEQALLYPKQSVELTRREFDLLRYLLEHKGKVVSREALLDHVWGFDFVGETNTVDVYIRFLRTKIDERFSIKLIHTVRGVGYAIREE